MLCLPVTVNSLFSLTSGPVRAGMERPHISLQPRRALISPVGSTRLGLLTDLCRRTIGRRLTMDRVILYTGDLYSGRLRPVGPVRPESARVGAGQNVTPPRRGHVSERARQMTPESARAVRETGRRLVGWYSVGGI